MLEYDEEPGIGKEYIHEKGESQIDGHEYADTHEVILSEDTQEEEIESDDREQLEDRERIAEFKNREEIEQSSRYPVSDTSLVIDDILSPLLSACDERDESSFCYRSNHYVEEDADDESCGKLPKIGGMDPLYDDGEELVLELEDIDVGECQLVEDDTTQIDGR